jgi:hypothetical protein
MKLTHLVITAFVKVGLQIVAIVQLSSSVAYSAMLGTTVSTALASHGITQPVFGSLSLLASVPFEIKIIKHYVKPKVQEIPKEIATVADKLKKMEAKYGKDWLDRVSAVADTLSKIDKKK